MKKKKRLRKWVKVTLLIIVTIPVIIFDIIGINAVINKSNKESEVALEIVNHERKLQLDQSNTDSEEKQEVKIPSEDINLDPVKLKYRMTYYYPGDADGSGNVTASGKSTKDFQLNERGWYTYKGKLVVATASKRLLSWKSYKNSTQPTYNLYDELTLNINGKDYEAIVMDVCGACMKSNKIDLYVKDKSHGLDTKIDVIKMDK